ncbi:HNH endonuclease family protein [Kineosporia rhizophila]|uniref:HNH endonuclease family protein n=1 Tax=Kineosporia TaxID=49184 RepID=UPI001E2B0A12|nr:HNH endonuclease family protein [Kineosporia sp. NBRC 101677]MCE0539059.1 HNH endonuclease family protein [Kineosporia rhizophila]
MNLVRSGVAALSALVLSLGLSACNVDLGSAEATDAGSGASVKDQNDGPLATKVLGTLSVKGRAAETGYDRDEFGSAWKDVDRNGCDQRNDVLKRDLTGEKFRDGTKKCVVVSGTLQDRYTGKSIEFRKAEASEIQIDHVVALQNSWVTGAFAWSEAKRTEFANDPLNLLAADGPTNSAKGAGDAATWLPPSKAFRCDYVARQVAVKSKYGNWVTKAEKAAISGVLKSCPEQRVPTSGAVAAPEKGEKGADDKKPAPKGNNGEAETPGAFCSPEGAKAEDSDGDKLTCSVKDGDDRARWRSAA